jgi:drug/metabolite transporter (DMT)-like permease
MHIKAYLALATAVIVWGVAPALIRSFSTTIGPWDAVFIRLVSVALMCLPFLPFSGIYIARKDWPKLLLVSCVGIFGYFLGSIYGFTYVKTGIGGVLIAVQPLIIALLAATLGTERLTLPVIIGLAVSFAGALYLFSDDLGSGTNIAESLFGTAMLMLCNVAFAINVVYSRGLVQTYGALRVTILTMILAAVPALAFFRPGVFDIIRNLDAFAWGSLFYLGFIGTIVVVIMWNFAVGQLRSATVGASLYVIPLLAAVSGWVVLGETLGSRSIMAGLIILAGVAISEFGGQWTVGQKKS